MQATSNSSQQDSPIAQARRARRRGGRRGGGRSRRGGEGVFDALDDPPGDIECIRCAYPDRVLPAALEKCLVEVLKDYFRELEEESIRDNFVITYELMDEMMDKKRYTHAYA